MTKTRAKQISGNCVIALGGICGGYGIGWVAKPNQAIIWYDYFLLVLIVILVVLAVIFHRKSLQKDYADYDP
jgi:amino acid transporter